MATEPNLFVQLVDRSPALGVGRLRDIGDGPYFAFDDSAIRAGLALSPLAMPLRPQPYAPGPRHQHRLRGLFADSIPDGWGLKVLHQVLRQAGHDPLRASPLTLLRAVGVRGPGALIYEPTDDLWGKVDPDLDLDALAAAAFALDGDEVAELVPSLRRTAGTSGGARPKVNVAWHPDGRVRDPAVSLGDGFRHVLVKFRSRTDPAELPAMESAYLTMASAAGLEVPPHWLLSLPDGELALVVERFDRVGDARRHTQSVAALLEVDPRHDVVDYAHLLDLARRLTGSYAEVLRALRLSAFNVLAGNRDDHTRNVAFVMDPSGGWRLSPAYDLTYSAGAGGYHAMSVGGEGMRPSRADVQRIGEQAGLDRHQVVQVLDEVEGAVRRWRTFASAVPMSRGYVKEIARVCEGG